MYGVYNQRQVGRRHSFLSNSIKKQDDKDLFRISSAASFCRWDSEGSHIELPFLKDFLIRQNTFMKLFKMSPKTAS